MDTPRYPIERLTPAVAPRDLRALAELLADAVESRAAVSFVLPFSVEDAQDWWTKMLASRQPRSVILVARDAHGIVGSVQLHPAWAPNQPHRAELTKLLVHRRARRGGLGTALMRAAEHAAREEGFGLLTLDAKAGGSADRLYRRLGWTCAGSIPGFALDTDGATLHDAAIFFKVLLESTAPAGT